MEPRRPWLGTAGWNIRSEFREAFPAGGSHLERYAARLNAVEINSSFYRPHRRATYERWADTVGPAFRFAVKLPKTISHGSRSDANEADIDRFAEEVAGLGNKLGIVLIQFPPSLAYDETQAIELLGAIGARLSCPLACEPRHASWFGDEVDARLDSLHVARVAADPAIVPRAAAPGGWRGVTYRRLHGSPRTYYSDYDSPTLEALHETLAADVAAGIKPWCIFDNTALGFATGNALTLHAAFDEMSLSSPGQAGR